MKKYFLNLIILLSFLTIFQSCKTNYSIQSSEEEYLKIDKKLDNNNSSKIDSIISPYKKELDESMNKIIGKCSGLTKGKPESTLGNWVADALLTEANNLYDNSVDFAAQNYGGLRIGEIPSGAVTIGKIYELMPFENYLSVLTVKGNTVKEFLDRIAIYGGWPISRNISFTIGKDEAENILIGGKPLDLNKTYKIALPDYVANGGDDCDFFAGVPQDNSGELIRDILIENIRQNKSMSSEIEKRITD